MKSGDEIDRRAEAMARFLTAQLAELTRLRKKSGKPDIKLDAKVSQNREDRARSPEDQARMIARNVSWTCNSSHMTNSARHVYLYQDGQIVWNLKSLETALGKDDYAMVMSLYAMAMKRQGLMNHKGTGTFEPGGGDPYHVELPASRLAQEDKSIVQCVQEYARLVKSGEGKQNKDFERSPSIAKLLGKLRGATDGG